MNVQMEAALDPEKYTVSLSLSNIPLENLGDVLANMAKPSWRQNIIDGIQGALAARDLGVSFTERKFQVEP